MEHTAVIDRFEGRFVILKLADGQELRWPAAALEADLREGSALRIRLSSSVSETAERERLARTLLSEILGDHIPPP